MGPEFTWEVARDCWQPEERPRVPVGPTTLEVLRSCPLRGCFEASTGYPDRMTHAGRVGTAFHRTLQSFVESPPAGSPGDKAGEARHRFERELGEQEAEMARLPREARLPRSPDRVRRATEAVLILARQLASEGTSAPTCTGARAPETPAAIPGTVEVEVPVRTADGRIRGRVDRAEHTEAGTHLVDYKSALRDDVPDRYVRQLQLYALMWNHTRGYWPATAEIVYPLTGTAHRVVLDVAACERVGAESAELVRQVEAATDVAGLAAPGDVCQVCAYRPWCEPFWSWQRRAQRPTDALESARIGFEGTIRSLERMSHHWRVELEWNGCRPVLVCPEERLPQLRRAHPTALVRILDSTLRGLRHCPQVHVSEPTELWLVRDARD